jgi:hypothetical protein
MVELASLFLPAPVRFNLTELVWSTVTVESSLFPKTNSTTVVQLPYGAPRTFFGRATPAVVNARKRSDGDDDLDGRLLPAARARVKEERKRKISPSATNKILILNAITSDGAAPAGEKQRQLDSFQQLVKGLFDQISYGAISFTFTATDFVKLPLTDDDYFWRQSDITKADDDYFNEPNDANLEKLNTATANNAKVQRGGDLFYDALAAAKAAGVAVDTYDGIYVNVDVPFLRCAAHGTTSSQVEDRSSARKVALKADTYLWHCSTGAHWGRRAHEIAHAFLSGDLYGGAKGSNLIATGSLFDLMGSHNSQQRPSGYNMVERASWIAAGNIKVLTPKTDYPSDKTYRVRAHGLTQDAANNDVYHVVKVEVHENLAYYVEVRQAPRTDAAPLRTTDDDKSVLQKAIDWAKANASTTQMYDTFIDGASPFAEHRSGVIVTKVDLAKSENVNQAERLITVLGPERLLRVGDAVDDPSNNIRFEVQALETSATGAAAFPARYRVRIRWTSAVADPNGLFNLRIRKWGAGFETKDVWFDSPENSYDVYTNKTEMSTGNALGNGDPPRVGKDNRYHAYLWNDGTVDATNLQVTYYLISPPAVGDNGKFVPLWTRFIAGLAAGNGTRATPNGADAPLWRPTVGEHTCAKVAVSKMEGETTVDDNEAQENVFVFDTGTGSPAESLLFEVQFNNPENATQTVFANADNVPVGWEVTFEHAWVVLPPLGQRSVRVAILSDVGRLEAPHAFGPITTDAAGPALPFGSCCERSAGSLTAVVWRCTDDAAGTQFASCTARGGFYSRHKKCSDSPCARSVFVDVACCTSNGCQTMPSLDRCAASGGTPLPLGSTCAADGARLCSGACCFTDQQRINLGSTFIETDPTLTCSNLDRGACKAVGGHLAVGRSCTDPGFVCVADEVDLRLAGVVSTWERRQSVSFNREAAEHLEEIGGVLASVRAKTRGFCAFTPAGPQTPAKWCIFEPSVRPLPNVRLRLTPGRCAARVLTTDASGCVDVDVTNVGGNEPWQNCWNNGTLLFDVDIVGQKLVAQAQCPGVLLRCSQTVNPTNGQSVARCTDRIDFGKERCELDRATNRCTRSTCPVTGSPCVRATALNGAAICRCQEPEEACAWDARNQRCTRPDCPTNFRLACVRDPLAPATAPRCTCGTPTAAPCAFDAARGRCTRPDCPLDPSRRCVLNGVDGSGFATCGCEAPHGGSGEQCVWDSCKQSCRTTHCPSNRKLPCVALRHDNGTMYCAGCSLGATVPPAASTPGFSPVSQHAVVEYDTPACLSTGGGNGAVNVLLTAPAPALDLGRALLDLLLQVRRFAVWWRDFGPALRAAAQTRLGAAGLAQLHVFAFEHWWTRVALIAAPPVVPAATWWTTGNLEPTAAFVAWWRQAAADTAASPATQRRLSYVMKRGPCGEPTTVVPAPIELSPRPPIAKPKDKNVPTNTQTCCRFLTTTFCFNDTAVGELTAPVSAAPTSLVCDSGGDTTPTPISMIVIHEKRGNIVVHEKSGIVVHDAVPPVPADADTSPAPRPSTPQPTPNVDDVIPDWAAQCAEPTRTTSGVAVADTTAAGTTADGSAPSTTMAPATGSPTSGSGSGSAGVVDSTTGGDSGGGGLGLNDTVEALLVAALAICALCCIGLFIAVMVCASQRRALKRQHEKDVAEARRLTELGPITTTASGRRRRTSSRRNDAEAVRDDDDSN